MTSLNAVQSCGPNSAHIILVCYGGQDLVSIHAMALGLRPPDVLYLDAFELLAVTAQAPSSFKDWMLVRRRRLP